MLDPSEELAVAAQFGVAVAQVRRDWLISHILGVLSREFGEELIFFGGTALARSFLPNGRLSEDIDLLTRSSRRDTAENLDRVLPRALRRDFPGLRWQPSLVSVREVEPAILITPQGIAVRIQLLSCRDYPAWPTAKRSLEQRYSDAPVAEILVPKKPSFAAWKTVTWAERGASRDLYDLWGLANIGAVDFEAGDLFRIFGPTHRLPADFMFAKAPNAEQWQRDLGEQTQLTVTAPAALEIVRAAWSRVHAQVG